jgi:hypothetical protein
MNEERSPEMTGETTMVELAREQIRKRLRQASVLVADDLLRHFDRFRDVLDEIVARTDALGLVLEVAQTPRDATIASQLKCGVLSATGGEPAREFLLIPFGKIELDRPLTGADFTFTREHAEAAVRWFEAMERKLAIDYEHQTFDRFNTRGDGLSPAAGWIGGLEVRDDGLWATNVTWTERAESLLRSGEYRYFSPVIFWSDETHAELIGLGPVALTNDPAMRGVSSLAAKRESDAAALPQPLPPREGDQADGTIARGVPEREGPKEDANLRPPPLPEQEGSRRQLERAEAEILLLRQKLREREAEAFVDRGMRQGKVLESTRPDWRNDYLRDSRDAEQRLRRAPVLLPPGRVLRLTGRGEVEPPAAPAARGRPAEAAHPLGIEAADLEAFERASAAGRVKYPVRGT